MREVEDKERRETNLSEEVEVYEIMGRKVDVPREGEIVTVLTPCGEANAVIITVHEFTENREVGVSYSMTEHSLEAISGTLAALGKEFEIYSLTPVHDRDGMWGLIALIEPKEFNEVSL